MMLFVRDFALIGRKKFNNILFVFIFLQSCVIVYKLLTVKSEQLKQKLAETNNFTSVSIMFVKLSNKTITYKYVIRLNSTNT